MPKQKAAFKPEVTFMNGLMEQGYTKQQAQQIMDFVEIMMKGQGTIGTEQLHAYIEAQNNGLNEAVTQITARWNEQVPKKTKISKLTQDEARRITTKPYDRPSEYTVRRGNPPQRLLTPKKRSEGLPPPYYLPSRLSSPQQRSSSSFEAYLDPQHPIIAVSDYGGKLVIVDVLNEKSTMKATPKKKK